MIHEGVTLAQAGAINTTEKILRPKLWRVIAFSAAGTTVGWYSFYIFGSLTAAIGPSFFPKGHDKLADLAFISSLAVAFAARPFGAVLFGRKGDLGGRKSALVRSSLILGAATAGIGLVPAYDSIGAAAPVILILLRVLQGLALGGQHGIVSVYVAEHAPETKVGFYTSFIQLTVTGGLLVSLAVILALQSISSRSLAGWGWRVPFILAITLVIWSLYFNRRMPDSPASSAITDKGTPHRPKDRKKSIVKLVLIGLFGATAAQGVLWYAGQFHTLFFLREVLKVETGSATAIVSSALILALPFYVFFGWLSDKVGPGKIIMAGCLLAGLSFYPAYRGMAAAVRSEAISIREMKNPATGGVKPEPVSRQPDGTFHALPIVDNPKIFVLVALVFTQTILVAMVSGPIGAYLAKLSPANVRCVSWCLSYQLGNSIFGAALPVISLAVITSSHSIYGGLIYPAVILLLTFISNLRLPGVYDGSGKN